MKMAKRKREHLLKDAPVFLQIILVVFPSSALFTPQTSSGLPQSEFTYCFFRIAKMIFPHLFALVQCHIHLTDHPGLLQHRNELLLANRSSSRRSKPQQRFRAENIIATGIKLWLVAHTRPLETTEDALPDLLLQFDGIQLFSGILLGKKF